MMQFRRSIFTSNSIPNTNFFDPAAAWPVHFFSGRSTGRARNSPTDQSRRPRVRDRVVDDSATALAPPSQKAGRFETTERAALAASRCPATATHLRGKSRAGEGWCTIHHTWTKLRCGLLRQLLRHHGRPLPCEQRPGRLDRTGQQRQHRTVLSPRGSNGSAQGSKTDQRQGQSIHRQPIPLDSRHTGIRVLEVQQHLSRH